MDCMMRPGHISPMKRRSLRFGLRTALAVLAAVSFALACCGYAYRGAVRQREAVDYILATGNTVGYNTAVGDAPASESEPLWKELTRTVTAVSLDHQYVSANDTLLAQHLGRLSGIEELYFYDFGGDYGEPVYDSTWKPLINLRRLRSLSLPRAGMVGLIHDGCPLQELAIYNDPIDRQQAERFAKFPLQTLRVLASDEAMPAIGTMGHLSDLDLSDSHLRDSSYAALGELLNLEVLSLKSTGVGDEGLRWLNGLPKLKVLVLEDTETTDRAMAHLTTLKSLETLDLHRTRVSRVGLQKLPTLPTLKRVFLTRSSQLTAADIDEFKRTRPDVKVTVGH